MDLPAQPTLADTPADGDYRSGYLRQRKPVISFVLDRRNGELVVPA